MCLAIPGKIISIDTAHELKMATVDFHGVSKEICIEWIDAGIGDYILTHAGSLSTLDEAERQRLCRILMLWQNIMKRIL
ncbi:MAG: HypC/HybG/HupF family hydrogenase formation chaperone [Barnesiella sp.]